MMNKQRKNYLEYDETDKKQVGYTWTTTDHNDPVEAYYATIDLLHVIGSNNTTVK